LHRRTIEYAGNQPLMKWMLIVVALRADGVEARDEVGVRRRA
jgi:hypothetical protein